MNNIAIGRQAIYDKKLELYGYELLFRKYGGQNQADFTDGDRATTDVILNALTEIGMKTLVGETTAFFNMTQSFLTSTIPLPEMPRTFMLEILEDIPVNESTIAGIRHFKAKGYGIALDDFIYHPGLEPFVELADIIKLDVLAHDRDSLFNTVKRLKEERKKILAEKVETHEDFKFCESLGIDLYQGYFFCRPDVVINKSIPINKLRVIQILASLHDPLLNASQLEADISSDVTLSYRLLRYINSVQYYLQQDIVSIKQAILLLGWDNIRSIATLLIMSHINDKPMELFKIGMVRAKMCEILGGYIQPRAKDVFFTAGLLSIIDAMMDISMEDVMAQLPLSAELTDALIDKQGVLGSVLKLVMDYVQDASLDTGNIPTDVETISNAHLLAVQWADATCLKLERIESAQRKC